MKYKDDELNELLECAIRERGAIEHFEALDRSMAWRKRLIWSISAAAACFILFGGIGIKLGDVARSAGESYILADSQRGGSEVTALIQENQIARARDVIVAKRLEIEKAITSPVSDDPDYLDQLSADLQELDLLEAICHLRQGHYFKAKRLLKEIVAEDGASAHEAMTVLEKL